MLALDLVDRRTMWRDYWIEWALAALFIAIAELAQWRVAALVGAPVPLRAPSAPAILIAICCFPIAAWLVVAARPLEAGPMKASRFTTRPPVDHLLAADDAGRRRPGRASAALLIGRLGYLSVAQNEHYQLLSRKQPGPADHRPAAARLDHRPQRQADRDQPLRLPRRHHSRSSSNDRPQTLAPARPAARADARRRRPDHQGTEGSRAASSRSRSPRTSPTTNMPRSPCACPNCRASSRMRGFSRFYPAGPAVAHLVGYVGAASAKEYEKEQEPAAHHSRVQDRQGRPRKDAREPTCAASPAGSGSNSPRAASWCGARAQARPQRPDRPADDRRGLQEYAARRMGDQSGALVAMDVANGDMLAFVSMPAFDPNSFSDGIGRTEWRMLSEDDHIPLLNKVAQGLYPSGSTIKPAMALAFLKQGIDPQAARPLPGRLSGSATATSAATRSTGRWTCTRRSSAAATPISGRRASSPIPQQTTEMVHYLGYGEKFDLPIPTQRFGTMPSPKWLEKKYHREWQGYDSANTSIGQGYVLINPMQLAVMPARLASGKLLQPRLLMADSRASRCRTSTPIRSISNSSARRCRRSSTSSGTAVGSKLPLDGIQMAGKTGTAQVFRLGRARPPVELGASRPRAVHCLRAGGQAALRHRLHHRAWRLRRLGRRADRARFHDLFVRPAEGDGRARSAREAMGRHAGRAQRRASAAQFEAIATANRPLRRRSMISSAIIPQPLARLPWRLILLVALICTIGLIVRSIRPPAARSRRGR